MLTMVVLGGMAALGVRLRPYWVARHQGQEANLELADLQSANLAHADLTGVNLQRADLRGADLSGANLTYTHLVGAAVQGARYNRRTHWPDGFDPQRLGATFREEVPQ